MMLFMSIYEPENREAISKRRAGKEIGIAHMEAAPVV